MSRSKQVGGLQISKMAEPRNGGQTLSQNFSKSDSDKLQDFALLLLRIICLQSLLSVLHVKSYPKVTIKHIKLSVKGAS